MRRNPSRKYSVRDLVVTAGQRFTQKQLAARLGVSDRTIRRWKNEGVQPAKSESYRHLKSEYDTIKRRITKENAKIGARPPDIPIPLLGERREIVTKVDARGRVLERGPSDWVNYDISRVRDPEAWAALKSLRDRGATVQLIYIGGASPDYPSGRKGTSAIDIYPGMTDANLRRLTLGGIDYKKLLHIAVLG